MSLFIPKPKPLYAPMLATFGGGSANGFRASGGNPISEGYPIVAANKDSTRYGNTLGIYTASNSNIASITHNANLGITALDPTTGDIYQTRNGSYYVYRTPYVASASGFNNFGYYSAMPQWHNSFKNGNIPWNVCNGAAFAVYNDKLYFGNTNNNGITEVVKPDFVNSVTTTNYSYSADIGCEEDGFSIGKYFYVAGYGGAVLWDMTTKQEALSVFGGSASNPSCHPVVSPRDNAVGIYHGETTTLKMMDYDDNSISINQYANFQNLGDSNTRTYGAPLLMMYAHTQSDVFSGSFSLNTHTCVSTTYSGDSHVFTSSSGFTGQAISNAQWGDGAYFPSTGAMKVIGHGNNEGAGAIVYEANLTASGVSSRTNSTGSTLMYLGNRGGTSGFFSHKESTNTQI